MSFEHAPVTKGLMITSGLSTFVIALFDLRHYFHLQFVPHISRRHQYWLLLNHHLIFGSSSDLVIAEVLSFSVGVQIERQFGSIKFASFLVVSLLLSSLLELISLLLFHRVGLNVIAAGPISLLFSILYQYSRIVPASYQFRIFGVTLTNKSFQYILALQLAISHMPGSIAAAIIGILAGQIYRSDLTNLKGYRISSSVVQFSERFLLSFIGSLRPPRRSTRALPDEPRPRTSQDGAQTEGSQVTSPARPNEDEVIRPEADAQAEDDSPLGVATGTRPSVVREWMNELTGRGAASSGLRVPTEAEIAQVMLMFPDVQREVVVGALQRSPIEQAVEALLSSNE